VALCAGGCWKTCERCCLVVDAEMCVAHCHPNVAMTVELACLSECRAAAKQAGDMQVLAGSMEIGEAFVGLVGNAYAMSS
jgi:hypothetical protein